MEFKYDSFEIWLNERPKWLQSTACFLIDNKRLPNEQEIEALSRLCLAEALGKEAEYSNIKARAIVQAAQRPTLRINKIFNVIGVNAIKSGASLNFGEKNHLTIIYGANGTGKTSFSRLLKQMCGSKVTDNLSSNIYLENIPPTSAQVEISSNGANQNIYWEPLHGTLPLLRHIHIFDSKTAKIYMEKNEATYEPSRMRFISSLITICDKVSNYLNQIKNQQVCSLPTTPQHILLTESISWFKSLKANTKVEEIEQRCLFPKEFDDERIGIESALSQKDIFGRLNTIAQTKKALERVSGNIIQLKNGLLSEKITNIIDARLDADLKRNIANVEAKTVFENAHIDGVGQEAWMALWKYAKLFSEQHAYTNHSFPFIDDGSHCVLCQQELTTTGKERLNHFQSYVQGNLEIDAKNSEKIRDKLIKELPILPIEHDWIVQMNLLNISEIDAKQYFVELKSRYEAIKEVSDIEAVPVFEWIPIENALDSLIKGINIEEKTLLDLQQDGHRQKLEVRVKELQAIQWLNQNKSAILTERTRLIKISEHDKAIKLTSTYLLTKKNNELAQLELDAGYQKRFEQELKKLGGNRLPVKPESKKQGKGKITFGLTLQGNNSTIPAERILSEGETRIVALAAFLADITGSGQNSPFIFDDPISSLDQSFEERVVMRLAELAKDRQVIIFTHRLSLLSLIEAAVKTMKDKANEHGLPAPVTANTETLRKLGNDAGIVAKLSLRDAKPAKAISRITGEFLPQLKKHFENGDADLYEREARQICSEFRILVEKCVESVLLNDVLVRFRRDLQTKGRLSALTKIQSNDCNLIDDLMTRYFVYEHSQSDELPSPSPDLSQIELDAKMLSDWINEFSTRK